MWGGVCAEMEGVWAKKEAGGSEQRLGGLCRALHVVWRRMQGCRRCRGAEVDVARLEETGGLGRAGQGWAGQEAGRAGQGRVFGAGMRGWACRCDGNVGNVSEKLQTFRSKAARGDYLLQRKKEGVWAKMSGGTGQRMSKNVVKKRICGQKTNFCGQRKMRHHHP